MTGPPATERAELERLRRHAERERRARLEAEALGERMLRALYQKQRELELLRAIAVIANEADAVPQALKQALDAICAHAGMAVGHAYLAETAAEPELASTRVWHLDDPERFSAFRRVTEATRFKPGIGLPGRVMVSGKPEWIADVTIDPNFPRARMGVDIVVRGAFAVPMLIGSEVVGVLEFFSDRPMLRDDDILELMVPVANQLGRMLERAHAEERVRRYRGHLEELVQERTRALSTANRELEAFSYSVSHDLRAPLRSLDGFSAALLEDYAGKLDDTARDYLQRLRNASQRMGDLIDDLLTLSQISRSQLRRQPVDLSALARLVARELRTREPERKVDFRIQDGLTTYGDPRLVRILLENLLSNAWKFTSKHAYARIEVGATRREGHPAFYVRDDGAGFDMTYVDKLFRPFQRLHVVSEFEGTGIGLATVQRIVNVHGGGTGAEGEVEKGATFWFWL